MATNKIFAYEGRRLRLLTLTAGSLVSVTVWISLGLYCASQFLSHGGVPNFIIAECEMVTFPIFVSVDITTRKVPTILLRFGSGAVYGALAFSGGYQAMVKAFVFTVVYGIPLVAVKLLNARAIGTGDIRLGVLIGPILSSGFPLQAIPAMLVVSCVLVIVYVAEIRLVKGVKIDRIPMVPFLLIAVLILQVARPFSS